MLGRAGEVSGLQEGVEVGSLVNDPAFVGIERIAACRAGAALGPDKALALGGAAGDNGFAEHGITMDEIKKLLGLAPDADEAAVLAALSALAEKAEKAAARAPEAVSAADGEKDESLALAERDKEAALAKALEEERRRKAADAELSAARAELQQYKKAGEDSFVQSAIQAGRIAPRDQGAIDDARALFRTDPVLAGRIYGRMPRSCGETIVAGREPAVCAARSLEDIYRNPNR